MWDDIHTQDLAALGADTAVFRVWLAMAMGAILGLERTRKQRPAGLRTYMLVCVAACCVMLTGLFLFHRYGPGFDPARMAAQVVSGIGFIGAGTIMVTPRHKVKGLTTAAGVWAAACLGIAIGAGYYVVAASVFVVLLLTMFFADQLEVRYYRNLRRISLAMIISSVEVLSAIQIKLKEEDIFIGSIELGEEVADQGICLCCVLRLKKRQPHQHIVDQIMQISGVFFAEQLDV